MSCFCYDLQFAIRVANTSESEPALFPAKKGQKPPPIFHTKKLIPLSFLLYFYVVIFPMPTQNCKKSFNSNSFPRFFFQIGQNGSKSARPKNFFPPHKSPKPPKTRQPATISHSAKINHFHEKKELNIQYLIYTQYF